MITTFLDFDLCNTLIDILINLIAGVIFSWIVWILNLLRYKRALEKFDNAHFDIFYKGVETKCRVATCTVKKNIISYTGYQVINGSKQGAFEGKFVMDIFNLRSGEGVHYHTGFDGFNFPKIIIKDDNTFFVETTFGKKPLKSNDEFRFVDNKLVPDVDDGNTDKDFEMFYQAYVWKRVN